MREALVDHTPRIIRSLVFTPAHDPDLVREHATRGMDALCLDMEDLTPRAAKQQARDVGRDIAAELTQAGVLVFARTNGLEDGMAEADLDAIVGPDLHCVSLPKTESPEQVHAYDELLTAAERRNGVAEGTIHVRPIIETAQGVRRAYDIAAASPRICYVGGVAGGWWGDLATSIGYVPTIEGRETHHVRARVLVDVRAAGCRFPIGGGTTPGSDPDAIRAFAEDTRTLGYTGMHCRGDATTIEVVNDVFTPTREEVAAFLAILPEVEAAVESGTVAMELPDGRTIDTVGLRRVHEQLELARRVGVIDAPTSPTGS